MRYFGILRSVKW